jgi:hypothetical protein
MDQGDDYYEQIEKASAEFARAIKLNPASLRYPFRRLIDSHVCRIKTSEDGRFRIYSWDILGGGSARYFNSIIQWKDRAARQQHTQYNYSKSEFDIVAPYVEEIHTVDVGQNRYYLTIWGHVISSSGYNQSIQAYTIRNSKLIDSDKLFKTLKDSLNNIYVDFSANNQVRITHVSKLAIRYDQKRKAVLIPLITEEEITNRYLVYRLRNGSFRYTGTEAY